MDTTDTVTAIRQARQQLRTRGEVDSLRRVAAIVGCGKSTVQKYWSQTEPEAVLPRDVLQPDTLAPGPAPPAFSLANMRAYYLRTSASPWPWNSMPRPPTAAYEDMRALWKEAAAEIGRADRQHYDVFNALAQQRVMDMDAHPALVQNEQRRSIARGVLNAIQADMDNVRMWAHRDGVELTDPRLS